MNEIFNCYDFLVTQSMFSLKHLWKIEKMNVKNWFLGISVKK